jgi:tRNA modification GTPase
LFDLIHDTIVAVATPAGSSRRGIVRCSGPDSLNVAATLCRVADDVDLSTSPGFRRFTAEIEIETGCCVPGELYLFRAPRSYTRQDCVEFHVPGSPSVLTMLVERCVTLGARPAQPGEFTARAFCNGAMDLTRAEAVERLINARSDGQLRAAHRVITGALADGINETLEPLAQLVALIEADIDFAEEPIEFITPADLKSRLTDVADRLSQLLNESTSTERVDSLPRILLVGKPNAGKSTLMNRLSGIDRSICSPIPHTTRDVLSAPIRIGRGEAVLLDSAGVDDNAEGLSREAGDIAKDTALRVDLVCLVVDISHEVDDAVRSLAPTGPIRCVVVCNKTDLVAEPLRTERVRAATLQRSLPACAISAKTGDGIEACRTMLADALDVDDANLGEDVVMLSARQRQAIESAMSCIERCKSQAESITETIDQADLLAFELREALESLGSVVGTVTTDDLLGRVFASFCIGK